MDVEGGVLTPLMVEIMLGAAVRLADTYHEEIRRVGFDGVHLWNAL